MRRIWKAIWNTFSPLLVGAAVVLAVLLAGARLVGLQVYTVLSGSMEPTYHTGSLIYVREIDPATITPGQSITFALDENTIATHRVVAVLAEADGLYFRTKGDANNAADGKLVHSANVRGTPIFTIPYLGYIANYIQHPPGTYIAISAGAVLLLLMLLQELISKDRSETAA